MTDIGFGLIDRRTVLVMLFSLIIAQSLWGFTLPVDMTNTASLFVDLVILTGYLYLARSLFRLPALIFAWIAFVVLSAVPQIWYQEQSFFSKIVSTIFNVILSLFVLPIGIINFGKRADQQQAFFGSGWDAKRLENFYFRGCFSPIFRILDRAGVVVIAVLATIPGFQSTVKQLGIIGLIIMVVLYVFRGNFTGLVRDFLEKQQGGNNEKLKEPEPETTN